jgi:magnesium chelatase subunit D
MAVRHVFPFSAVVGQDDLKLALFLNAIDPLVGGTLIRGERGSGKTTIVRALGGILPIQRVVAGCPYRCDPDDRGVMCDECRARDAGQGPALEVATEQMRIVELPINASLERVVGGIDLEAALRRGVSRFSPGILAAANRNILYIDEVNLIGDTVVDALLDVAASGVNTVEREGVSFAHPARFALIGTMNNQEGELRPQLLDRFGVCVDVRSLSDVETRADVAERDAAFQAGDPAFAARFRASDRALAAEIVAAAAALPEVSMSRQISRLICSTCVQANVAGHRADVVIHHAVAVLAALRGRDRVTPIDVTDAGALALTHRGRTAVQGQVPLPDGGDLEPGGGGGDSGESAPPPPGNATVNQPKMPRPPAEGEQPPPQDVTDEDAAPPDGEQADGIGRGSNRSEDGDEGPQIVTAPRQIALDVPLIELPRSRRPRIRSGKRMRSEAVDTRGRHVSSRIQDPVTDIAIDATLRAAAPYQHGRGRAPGGPLVLRRGDLRQKVREHKVGSLVIFAVDGSASMAAEQRMAMTKSVILSLLHDAYVRRDRVAAVVFRGAAARVVLEPTSSVSVGERELAALAVGGSTPLPHGLLTAYQLARREQRLDPSVRPLIVLISDGHANVALGTGHPKAEALEIADRIGQDGLDALVVDTAPRANVDAKYPMFHDLRPSACPELAERMGAAYFSMTDMDAGRLGHVVVRMRSRRAAR